MLHRSTRLRLAAAVLAALTTASCTTEGPGRDSPSNSAKPSTPESTSAAPSASPSQSPSDWTAPKTLVIGAKIDQPGFNWFDNSAHAYAGFEKELADFLGEKIGFEPTFIDVTSEEREKKLIEGPAQLVIATYSITDKRKEVIDFAGPYLKTRQGLLVRADDTEIKEAKDTAHKQICTVRGSTSKAGKDNPLDKDAVINDDYKDYDACVKQLRNGNVAGVWTDRAILFGFAQRYPDTRVVDKINVGKYQLYGIGLPKHNKPMCEALKEALKAFVKDEWLSNFTERFRNLVQAEPDAETLYRTDEDDIDTHSQCTP